MRYRLQWKVLYYSFFPSIVKMSKEKEIGQKRKLLGKIRKYVVVRTNCCD